mmetsp:Transcript_11205/g.35566  ORF Transcript_11205/g.35566 Transcript_11205/m.35566 type:complete len:265 (+) Transcript_11205:372-1166(+)
MQEQGGEHEPDARPKSRLVRGVLVDRIQVFFVELFSTPRGPAHIRLADRSSQRVGADFRFAVLVGTHDNEVPKRCLRDTSLVREATNLRRIVNLPHAFRQETREKPVEPQNLEGFDHEVEQEDSQDYPGQPQLGLAATDDRRELGRKDHDVPDQAHDEKPGTQVRHEMRRVFGRSDLPQRSFHRAAIDHPLGAAQVRRLFAFDEFALSQRARLVLVGAFDRVQLLLHPECLINVIPYLLLDVGFPNTPRRDPSPLVHHLRLQPS